LNGVEEESGRKDFDWMDFRLSFGCQTKVTGMFRKQLEDGIMGMDNRKGSFWLQLHDHYKRNGYVAGANNGDDDDDAATFDPTQFSLCFDRQPLSMDLRPGVGSGALTLGGTDRLLHNTDMVYANNVTPHAGWYSVRIKAMFLRTHGGTLSEPHEDKKAVKYLRVDAKEDTLNGSADKSRGVILDSGTTDTYLPELLKVPFEDAWKKVFGDSKGAMTKYHHNLVEMTHDQVKSLPTILLVLSGHSSSNENHADAVGMARSHKDMFKESKLASISKSDVVVAIPPAHYMEESSTYPGKYTARLYFTERYGAQSILGSNVLMGHEVNFDAGKGRVGFSESHCDYERYVTERNARRAQEQHEEGVASAQNGASELGTTDLKQGEKEKDDSSTNAMGSDLAASGWRGL